MAVILAEKPFAVKGALTVFPRQGYTNACMNNKAAKLCDGDELI